MWTAESKLDQIINSCCEGTVLVDESSAATVHFHNLLSGLLSEDLCDLFAFWLAVLVVE